MAPTLRANDGAEVPDTDRDLREGSAAEPTPQADGWPEGELSDGAEVQFFSTPPAAPLDDEDDGWRDDSIAPPMPRQERLARLATLVMVGITVFGIGGFAIASAALLPQPVHLAERPVLLPTPSSDEGPPNRPDRAEPVPAPEPAGVALAVLAPGEAVARPSVDGPSVGGEDGVTTDVDSAVNTPSATGNGARAPNTNPDSPGPRSARTTPTGTVAATVPTAAARPAQKQTVGSGRLIRQAYGHLNSGRFQQAERLAARATVSNPKSADAWIVLGAARAAQGDAPGAQRAYRLCLARVPEANQTPCRPLIGK